jgi:hypothetical protein
MSVGMVPVIDNPVACKERFAHALLRWPHDAFKAALTVFPTDMQMLLFAVNNWQHDAYVLEHKAALLDEHGPDHFLPTRSEMMHDVYHLTTTIRDPKAKIDAFRLYADVAGFVKKDAASVNVNLSQNVLMVKEVDEVQVKERQRRLLLEAAQDVD